MPCASPVKTGKGRGSSEAAAAAAATGVTSTGNNAMLIRQRSSRWQSKIVPTSLHWLLLFYKQSREL
jgi:hypothetical protein